MSSGRRSDFDSSHDDDFRCPFCSDLVPPVDVYIENYTYDEDMHCTCGDCHDERIDNGVIICCSFCGESFYPSRLNMNPKNNKKELCPHCDNVVGAPFNNKCEGVEVNMKPGTWRRYVAVLVALILLMFGIWATISVARSEIMYVTVEDGPLRGRSKPSLGAGVECRFDDQERVNVLSMADGWAQLDYGGEAECSYVSWDYLTDNDDTEYVVKAPGGLNVRNNPDGDRVIGKLKDGAVVGVVFTFDGWAKIKKGWVDVRYLEPVGLDLSVEEE